MRSGAIRIYCREPDNMHRTYENDDIAVFWDSEKCRHAHKCVEGSPKAFSPMRRPWIDLGEADTTEVWQAIDECPSGALSCVYKHDIRVEYDESNCRSVAYDGESRIGECDFQETPDGCVIYHTEVLPTYGNKGIAKRLVYKIVEEAERQKKAVVPTCSYAAKILE